MNSKLIKEYIYKHIFVNSLQEESFTLLFLEGKKVKRKCTPIVAREKTITKY